MSTTSSTIPVATTADAQTWVYPPPGTEVPPLEKTSNIGPVHLHDKMILQWQPSTQPKIGMKCSSLGGVSTWFTVAEYEGQPVTYEFNSQAQQVNASDDVYCWMYFDPSLHGNTVVWQFLNTLAEEVTIWRGNAAPTSVTAPRGSATSPKVSPPTSPESNSSGLSTGESAGIGIGVAVGVLAVIGIVMLFFRCQGRQVKQSRNQSDHPRQPRLQHLNPVHELPPWERQPPRMQEIGYGDVSQRGPAPISELASSTSKAKRIFNTRLTELSG